MAIEVKVQDLLLKYQELSQDHSLIKHEIIVENVPLEPVWKELSSLFLEKIKHIKRCSTARRYIQYTLDASIEHQSDILQMCLQLTESGDTRINEKVCNFLSEFLVITTSEAQNLRELFRKIYFAIEKNLDRNITQRPALLGSEELINVDDTTGWQRLEGLLRCYHSVCLGMAQKVSFQQISLGRVQDEVVILIQELLSVRVSAESEEPRWFEEMIEKMAKHSNRHLREMTFHFLGDLFPMLYPINLSQESLLDWSLRCVRLIPCGLEDDWSQIRYAATRSLHSIASLFARYDIFLDHAVLREEIARIAPRICLNRFHPARSVQSLSLETWKTHFGREGFGRCLLSETIEGLVDYYIFSTRHKNHMICEAACLAIGEAVNKLSSSLSSELTDGLLDSLSTALQDERWPVRDAALLSSGGVFRQFGGVFSEIVSLRRIETFFPLWRERLQDSIWSVRENAAMTFAEASQSNEFNEVTLQYCQRYLEDHLLTGVSSEAGKSSKIFSFLPEAMLAPSPASQTSLPTKAGLKKGWGCCIDCTELRKASDWEISHGAFYLIRELYRSSPSFYLAHSLDFRFSSSLSISTSSSLQRRRLSLSAAVTILVEKGPEKLQSAIIQDIPQFFSILEERKPNMTEADYTNERQQLIEAIVSWMRAVIVKQRDVIEKESETERQKATPSRSTTIEDCQERLKEQFPFIWEEIKPLL